MCTNRNLIEYGPKLINNSKPAIPCQAASQCSIRPYISLADLNLYLRLWKYYTVDSAMKIQLGEEQNYLQRSIEWLTIECNTLRQCCNDKALELFSRGLPMIGMSRFRRQVKTTLTA